MAHEVFISHSHKDTTAAKAVCAALEANGIRCWIAPRDINPGEDWAEAISKSIDDSRVMVLVFSNDANDSDQIKNEVGLAADSRIPIAPIRISDVKPRGHLRYHLARMHWMDALTPPLEQYLREFALQVRGLLQATGSPPGRTPHLSATPSWDEPTVVREEFTNSLAMKFVRIEAGEFVMGSPKDEEGHQDSEVQHRVKLTKPFSMATTPVTQEQWRAVMGTDPSNFKGNTFPVEQVSWEDAVSFCKRLSEKEAKKYRLPTEAEWEYCCRAGTTTPFNTGVTISTDQANYDGTEAYGKGVQGEFRQETMPVGRFRPNAWGLYDMHGNVCEWCSDGFEYQQIDDVQDPIGDESSSSRVMRGGCWTSSARFCRAAYRDLHSPGYRYYTTGFRVCLEL